MKLVKESLNQTFTRGNEDKLKSLGVGVNHIIRGWMKDCAKKYNLDYDEDASTAYIKFEVKDKERNEWGHLEYEDRKHEFTTCSNYYCDIETYNTIDKYAENYLNLTEKDIEEYCADAKNEMNQI